MVDEIWEILKRGILKKVVRGEVGGVVRWREGGKVEGRLGGNSFLALGRGKGVMARYADDFVILCAPSQSAAMRERLENGLERRELKLNETKTGVLDDR